MKQKTKPVENRLATNLSKVSAVLTLISLLFAVWANGFNEKFFYTAIIFGFAALLTLMLSLDP